MNPLTHHRIKVHPSYSFWRHPIRWVREYKMHRAMQQLTEHLYEESESEINKHIEELLINGKTIVGGKEYYYGRLTNNQEPTV